MELVAAVRSVKAVSDFVEGGPLGNALADLGLEAAKDALIKAFYAKDKRSQIWSAINHLEEAEVALRKATQDRKILMTFFHIERLAHLIIKRRYILGLMAICYRYLDERELAERTCLQLYEGIEGKKKGFVGATLGIVRDYANAINLLNYPERVLYDRQNKKYLYDVRSFHLFLNNTYAGPQDLSNLGSELPRFPVVCV
jgi:hypothetical protein